MIDVRDDDFGAVLNCAVRYAIGRKTYMPSIVIGFITPLLSEVNNRTLWCFERDLEEMKGSRRWCDLGLDEHRWFEFYKAVRVEICRREAADGNV